MDVQDCYDLKGSTKGRSSKKEHSQSNNSTILKDLDILPKSIKLNPDDKARLLTQISQDTQVRFIMGHHFNNNSNNIKISSCFATVFASEQPYGLFVSGWCPENGIFKSRHPFGCESEGFLF